MRLVVDLGGTNLRVALASAEPLQLHAVQRAASADIGDLAGWLSAYLQEQGNAQPDSCVIGVAGPVANGRVAMTNTEIQIDQAELSAALGLSVHLINDFAAVAWSLPQLVDVDLRPVGQAQSPRVGNRAVLGPGTGLGVAGLIASRRAWAVLSGEGGHAGLATGDEIVEQLVRDALGQSFLAAEDVLCGPGLVRIYRALGGRESDTPQAVAAGARGGEDAAAVDAVRCFTLWLGRFAGDLALTLGAQGGVYLAGGILPAWGDLFDAALFRRGFEDKADFTDYVSAIPSFLITRPEPALLGLAVATPD